LTGNKKFLLGKLKRSITAPLSYGKLKETGHRGRINFKSLFIPQEVYMLGIYKWLRDNVHREKSVVLVITIAAYITMIVQFIRSSIFGNFGRYYNYFAQQAQSTTQQAMYSLVFLVVILFGLLATFTVLFSLVELFRRWRSKRG
jgi:hypothetical protein